MSREVSRRIGAFSVVVNLLFIGSILVLLLGIVFGISFNVSVPELALMSLAAVINFASVVLLYRALQIGIVSLVSPIAYSYPAITAVLGVVVLAQRVTLGEALSLAGIIAGAILVSTKFKELRNLFRRSGTPSLAPGVEFAVVSTVLSGLTFFLLGIAATQTNPLLPILVLRFVGAMAGVAVASLARQKLRINKQIFSPRLLVMGMFTVLGFLSFNEGVVSASNSLPIVASLGGMASAFQVTYAIVFLREKPDSNQAVGILLLIAGVFTLLYLSA
jgi:transporter family protein